MIRDPHSEEEKAFRRFLRESRKALELTQADLACRLGVPQSFVSKYESGERLLTFIETLTILAELGVSIDEATSHIPAPGNATKS